LHTQGSYHIEKGIKIYNKDFEAGFEDVDTGSVPVASPEKLRRPITEPTV